MVFEDITAFLVDKFLGNYLENFDDDQLKISLWKGDIIFENVYLKTNALDNLNGPFEIVMDYLGKLIFFFFFLKNLIKFENRKSLNSHPMETYFYASIKKYFN